MGNRVLKVYALILAGGSGTRLWPLSRESFPKQFSSLIGSESLIQSTIKRLLPIIAEENISVVLGESHKNEVVRHLNELRRDSNVKIVTEPCGRNTAPAILLGILTILEKEKDAIVLVFPSDHIISDDLVFQSSVKGAISLAEKDYVVTLGVKPVYPETGYGYIEGGDGIDKNAFEIKRFVEKPSDKKAKEYFKSEKFFWNCGIFAFKASTIIKEYEKHASDILKPFTENRFSLSELTEDSYNQIPNISLDYAIMEKTEIGAVLPTNFKWSDVGSWKSVYEFLPKENNNNVLDGDVITRDSKNCLIRGNKRLIVANGLNDIAVVDTDDAILVSSIDKTEEVKSIVNELKERGRSESRFHAVVYKPWGYYIDLSDDEDYKVKKIVVNPGSRLSLQKHKHRAEHWVVSNGTAKVTNGDDIIILKEKGSVFIRKSSVHRLENIGSDPLHIIEVQFGKILEEDDITRLEDDFGRGGK